MHFKSLLAFPCPQYEEDLEYNQTMDYVIDKLNTALLYEPKNFMLSFKIEELTSKKTLFANEIRNRVYDIMEKYYIESEDKRYCAFKDCTEEFQEEYEGVTDCMRLPEGTIVDLDHSSHGMRFKLIDGKVYERGAGFLKHDKRTKRAKKMKALPNYPLKKVYKTLEDYVINANYGCYNEETNQYGYWHNPNGVYDYFSIGGRWPAVFLVKETCKEYTLGECNPYKQYEEYKAPEGFKWVCGARKKDIEWDMMHRWNLQEAQERYCKLKRMFTNGKLNEGFYGELVDDGITRFGEYIFKKDESFREYLKRYRIPTHSKYPIRACTLFSEEQAISQDDFCIVDGEIQPVYKSWIKEVNAFLDGFDDDTMLVGIDYHM